MNAAQEVFDNRDLRKQILVHVEKHAQLKVYIRSLIDEMICENWYNFCKCSICTMQSKGVLMNHSHHEY